MAISICFSLLLILLPHFPSSRADVERSKSSEPASPGDAKRPKSTRGGVSRRENQSIDGSLDDGAG
ncbi:hypothetical protein Bca52824_096011 [Brassica carinata]|uniref:Uncharacterized protein n=1 Tax=Brassica carinata TaxID=52824 RepID=A0A8X7NY11_BRACI|nr:hypothetical protein Bca52824_096011 [Brassica carinata]